MQKKFDQKKLKKDFPFFNYNPEIVYLDNAATTQKPQLVIDAISDFYLKYNASVARSSHMLSEKVTQNFEEVRKKTASFLNVTSNEIIFTKNSTESLNIVALSWGLSTLSTGDVILTLKSEHNSSLLPWKNVAAMTGAEIVYMPMSSEGVPDIETTDFSHVKVLVFSHVSNVLGAKVDAKKLIKRAKEQGATVIVDGSQAVGYLDLDLKKLGCDFYAFSAHKCLGPTGLGVLWGRKNLLNSMTPVYLGGGVVVGSKTKNLKEIPHRFEYGTPNIAGVMGFGAALEYLATLDLIQAREHIVSLSNAAVEQLSKIDGAKILGPAVESPNRASLVSFYFDEVHSHDIAAILSTNGVAVRSGMQCAMQLYESYDIPASTRASFYFYNSLEDVQKLVEGVKTALKMLR